MAQEKTQKEKEEEAKQKQKDAEEEQKQAIKQKKLAHIQERCMTISSGSISFDPSLTIEQKLAAMTCICGYWVRLEKIRNDVLVFRCTNWECRAEYAIPIDHPHFKLNRGIPSPQAF